MRWPLSAAITGTGAVTPVGDGVPALLAALRQGRQGVSRLTGVPVPRGKDRVGLVRGTEYAGADRAYAKARAACEEALAQAAPSWGDGEEVALVVATVWGDSGAAERRWADLVDAGDEIPDDLLFALRCYPNGSIADRLGDRFGLWGPRLVISNACASGNIALGAALDLIRTGRCRAALVVGTENLNLTGLWGADRSGFVGHSLRPFHARRDGTILGEGAAAVVLETAEDLVGRTPLGWLEGFGCVCDKGAAAITLLEDGSGLRRSMALALEDAGRQPGEVLYVNAHAPGTPLIDRLECKAVADLLAEAGADVTDVRVNATKSVTTHMTAASAVAEAIACLLQMRHGFLHPNAGLDEADPDLETPVVGPEGEVHRIDLALSNACGGGGLNTTVVITSEPADRSADDRPAGAIDDDELVVTGSGDLSHLGAGALTAGGALTASDPSRAPGAGRLQGFDVSHWYPEEGDFPYMNRAAQLAAAAGAMAIRAADLATAGYASDRVAVLAGTWLAGGPQASEVLCRGLARDPNLIRPSMALDHGNHLGAALVCRHFGFDGATYTLTGSTAAGLTALVVGGQMLSDHRADAAVVLGYDALDDALARAEPWLAECLPEAPLTEGAASLVLERAGTATRRGARTLGRLGRHHLLAGPLDEPAARMRTAERLATALDGAAWDEVWVAGGGETALVKVAEHLGAVTGRAAPVHRLSPRLGHAMAGDALLAVVAALAGRGRALVLAADRRGTVGAVEWRPPAERARAPDGDG